MTDQHTAILHFLFCPHYEKLSPTCWRSQGISCKCSQASPAISGLSGAVQPRGRCGFSGILVLEQDVCPKAMARTERPLSYSQLFLGCPTLSSMWRILSISRVSGTLHQQYPKGPPPATCPHKKDTPDCGPELFLNEQHPRADPGSLT